MLAMSQYSCPLTVQLPTQELLSSEDYNLDIVTNNKPPSEPPLVSKGVATCKSLSIEHRVMSIEW